MSKVKFKLSQDIAARLLNLLANLRYISKPDIDLMFNSGIHLNFQRNF